VTFELSDICGQAIRYHELLSAHRPPHRSHQPTDKHDGHTAATSRPLNMTVTTQPTVDR
jgi:hypothetical protein